ncbi:hypothetical protein DB330_07490 [Lacticaseibacillus casei]|nr:hypothetical protein [Lacticaseibacillus casei]PTU94708.1 hypothetical protein DB330_07490 [Lacticaseibacillus casei]PTU96991.1 hypothetical protein DB326_07575 [Lacticaseibacillus casei]
MGNSSFKHGEREVARLHAGFCATERVMVSASQRGYRARKQNPDSFAKSPAINSTADAFLALPCFNNAAVNTTGLKQSLKP